MAEKKTLQNASGTDTPDKKTEEIHYTVDEIAEAAGIFGVAPDLARAAFAREGKLSASEGEARKIIEKFKVKEVR